MGKRERREPTPYKVYLKRVAELSRIETENPWVKSFNSEVTERGLQGATSNKDWGTALTLVQTLKIAGEWRVLSEQVQACSEAYNEFELMARDFFHEDFEG